MTFTLRTGLLAITALFTSTSAQAGPIKGMDHYFRVAGAINAANGNCTDLRANVRELIELGKPFQSKTHDEALEQRAFVAMAASLNETGARIHNEGHDVVCGELFDLYGPTGTEVPGLLTRRVD